MKFAAIALILLGTQQHIWRTTPQAKPYEVGITCSNGGDPTVVGNFDGMLMISCGE